nr:DUF6049 family protein [Ornithinimicrobium sp. F0845]
MFVFVSYAVALALVVMLAPAPLATASTAGATTTSTAAATTTSTAIPTTSTDVTAADPDLVPVQVRLDAVTPAIAGPGTGVLLTGTLSNAGPDPVMVHDVRVSTAYRGLDTRAAVDAWAVTGDLATPNVIAEDHIGALLAPGALVHFYAPAPAEALEPGFDFATLPLRIEVTEPPASEGQEAQSMAGSELRTFLPWRSTEDDSFNPIDIAWVAPLTLPGGAALVDPDDETRAAAWAAAIGPGSRNTALLEGLAGTAATFVVDPAILEPLDPVASLTEAVAPPGEEPTPTPEQTQEPTEQPTSQPTEHPGDDATSTPEEPQPGSSDTQTSGPEPDGELSPAPTPLAPAATETPPADGTEATTTGGPDDPDAPQQPVEPPTPPTTEDAVRALAEQLATVPEEQLWWLPVGDTDTGAMLELDEEVSDVAALVGRPPAQTPVAAGRTDVAWPLATSIDDQLIDRLSRVWTHAGGALGTKGVGNGALAGTVLPSSAVTDDAHTGSAAVTHTSGTTLLGYDERLSGIVATAGEPERDGRGVQRFLAETLATYQEQPAQDRSVVVAIPRAATVDATTLRRLVSVSETAPWLAQATATQLLDSADPAPVALTGTAPVEGDLTAYSRPGPSPLTAARITGVEQARADLDGACEIVPGSEEACETWWRALDRQYSARWRQDPDLWDAPVEQAAAVSQEILEGLTINPTTINFFADEGVILITVTNELPLQIDDLRMTVRPGNARLRILAQPEPITIGPESRATVQFRAKAIAAGNVPLNTTLSTPNGTPVGQVAETEVRVRPTGVWIYWLLGGVAGAILVLGLVRALRPRPATQPPKPRVPPAGPELESP